MSWLGIILFTSVCFSLPSLYLVVCAVRCFWNIHVSCFPARYPVHTPTTRPLAARISLPPSCFPTTHRWRRWFAHSSCLLYHNLCSRGSYKNAWRVTLWWHMVENVTVHYIFNSGNPLASIFLRGKRILLILWTWVCSGNVFGCAPFCTNGVRPVLLCH